MHTSKKAMFLVIISSLLIMLTFTSPVAFARSKHVLAPTQCTGNYDNLGVKTSTTCCDASWDEDTVTHKITNYMKWCRICDIAGGNCGPEWQEARRQLGTGVSAPGRVGTALPTSGNNTGGVNNGQTGLPSRLGNALPPSSLPSSNAVPPPPTLPSTTKQQTLTTTCPNGLPPDANGNCSTPTTTTNTNQQSGSASNNNNPQQGHHHKGSNNQPTQTAGGGQELTATKKHKGSKTDQGTTTQPSS